MITKQTGGGVEKNIGEGGDETDSYHKSFKMITAHFFN